MERASEASVVKRAERSERSEANKRSECPHGLVDNRFEILTSCSLMQTKDTGPGHWTLDTGHWTEKYARGSPSKNKNIHDANYVHFRREKNVCDLRSMYQAINYFKRIITIPYYA